MLLAIFCSNTVLPVRGEATIKPLCPLPMGVTRSIILVSSSAESFSKNILFVGCKGVRSSNTIFSPKISGFSKLIASTRKRAKYRSVSLGGLI